MAGKPADREQDIQELLVGWGFVTGEEQLAPRSALEAAGVTRSSKSRISEPNARRADGVLASSFARSCAHEACRAAVAAALPRATLLVSADRSKCEHCGGSDNARAAKTFLAACRERPVERIVVVGGSPEARRELAYLFAGALTARFVDGTGRRSQVQAHGDLVWADLALVLGGTELAHKISDLYTRTEPPLREKVLQTPRRGIASIMDFAAEHLAAKAGRKGRS